MKSCDKTRARVYFRLGLSMLYFETFHARFHLPCDHFFLLIVVLFFYVIHQSV